MARVQALALLVSVLSASAFAPFGWTASARTAPALDAASYIEAMAGTTLQDRPGEGREHS